MPRPILMQIEKPESKETEQSASHTTTAASATAATAMIHTNRDTDNTPEEKKPPAASSSAAKAAAADPTPAPGRRRKKGKKQETPPTKDMVPLHPHFQPGKLDVICSRGKFAYNSPGNCWFRTMVEEQMDNYANASTKTDKSFVVSILVNRVRHANPEGGFIKNIGGRWYRVSDRYSREKVGQQFRDLLHTKYRSSTKAKAEKRKRKQSGELSHSEGMNNSSEEETSNKSTRERIGQTSPRNHNVGGDSPGSTNSASSMDESSRKIPPLNLDRAPAYPPQLQPQGYTLTSGIQRGVPDLGERHPYQATAPVPAMASSANLDQDNMDLAYLDDFEPLPVVNAARQASRSNSLDLMRSNLRDSFPNIFNPPDLHQSLPPSFFKRQDSTGNDNRQQQPQRPEQQQQQQQQQQNEESDPLHQPWHMSI